MPELLDKTVNPLALHALTAALRWHLEAGADCPLGHTPVDRLRPEEPRPEKKPALSPPASDGPPQRATQSRAAPFSQTPSHGDAAEIPSLAAQTQDAVRRAAAASTREALREAIAAFDGLAIKRTATNLVFSDGNPLAPVMVVGEAPGADEDRIGRPFVGVSGQLLDKMLACIDLARTAEDPDKSVYIANILNWRPPGNRTPSDSEVALSLPFIEKHILLIRPRLLVMAGGVSAKALLGTSDSISRLRGRWHAWSPRTPGLAPADFAPIPALATFHPSYLLRAPEKKRESWSDLLVIHSRIAHVNPS